ncbi:LVIVD repeat-containing protein [Rudanella lutea]|uniref:LVIVD repeat-containing protein n=1 Tax=Rudanella lutea TaxID=451374 RepID=UPI00037351DB|nr:hypothetical protein [Rudanella lutea]
MKRILYSIPVLFLALFGVACTDKCTETRTFRRFTPVTLTLAQVRQGIGSEAPRTLQKPGKIYTKDGFLFINELKEGIHVIDNRNPNAPQMVSFIRIPGNGDMAVRNNILYADSYMDLVAFDISDVKNIRPVNRVNNIFPNGQFEGGYWYINQATGDVQDQRVDYVTEQVQTNCQDNVGPTGGWWGGAVFFDTRGMMNAAPSTSGGGGQQQSTNGTAGSMARFALYNNYLYTVNSTEMQLFDIRNPADPKVGNKIQMGWGIETIFPYKDKLFIGSQTGMFIYDNKNPEKPERLSVFQHARVCDPVVVHEDKAYVTLRSGNTCQGFTNQLDVVDISNLLNPKLIKSYPMRNPHGLGVDFPNLFICEGAYGLKSFDASDALNIDKNLREHIKDIDAYDVIPLDKSLLMIGRDGFYQYDYSNPKQLRLMSKIPVKRPNAIS